MQAAADALGWPGKVLPAERLLGVCGSPVVRIDHEAHRHRAAHGDVPELDEDVLSMWEWPEYPAPPRVVELLGLLVAAPTGKALAKGISTAGRWRGFGPSAVVVDHLVADHPKALWCSLHGIGVVDHQGAVIVAPDEHRLMSAGPRRAADRWVEERLYAHALATCDLA